MIDIDANKVMEVVNQYKVDGKAHIEDMDKYVIEVYNNFLTIKTLYEIITVQYIDENFTMKTFSDKIGDEIRAKAEYHQKRYSELCRIGIKFC
jgi:hypothetical protein